MVLYSPISGLVVPKISVSLIDPDTGQSKRSGAEKPPLVAYTDIKRGKNGKMIMVRHQGKRRSAAESNSVATAEDVKEDERITSKDTGAQQNDGKPWTPEDDAKLKEMKENGRSWADIMAELLRPKHELRSRYNEIKEVGAAKRNDRKEEKDTGKKENNQKNQDQSDKSEGRGNVAALFPKDDDKVKDLLATNTNYQEIAKQLGVKLDKSLIGHFGKLKVEIEAAAKGKGNNQENVQNQHTEKEDRSGKIQKSDQNGPSINKRKTKSPTSEIERKPTSRADSVRSGRSQCSEPRFTMNEWVTLHEDDMFTFDELKLLSEIIMKDSDMTWLRVASVFHDKTGRRVHPADIADKFDALTNIAHCEVRHDHCRQHRGI